MKININISKQHELNNILDIILDVGKDFIKPEMVIVFGDYVKNSEKLNNLVREGDQVITYMSVIQIMIITKRPTQEKNMRLSREISSKIKSNKEIKNPVNIFIEDIFSFKQSIKELRYFYLNILNDGIFLYDSGKYKIKNVKKITNNDIKQIQKEDFDSWFAIASEFFIDYKNAFDRKSYNIAVFYLHQASELFMSCYLLVKTGYKPKTHDLEILYSKIKEQTNVLNFWFDLNLKKEIICFEILRSAYIDVRYKKNYDIEIKNLLFLANKVIILRDKIKNLCLKELKK